MAWFVFRRIWWSSFETSFDSHQWPSSVLLVPKSSSSPLRNSILKRRDYSSNVFLFMFVLISTETLAKRVMAQWPQWLNFVPPKLDVPKKNGGKSPVVPLRPASLLRHQLRKSSEPPAPWHTAISWRTDDPSVNMAYAETYLGNWRIWRIWRSFYGKICDFFPMDSGEMYRKKCVFFHQILGLQLKKWAIVPCQAWFQEEQLHFFWTLGIVLWETNIVGWKYPIWRWKHQQKRNSVLLSNYPRDYLFQESSETLFQDYLAFPRSGQFCQ